LRYFLLRHIRATADGDFTVEMFERAHDADLADQLGNLVARVTSMVTRYFDSVVPAPSADVEPASRLRASAEAAPARVDAAMDAFDPNAALAAIWDLVGDANKMIVEVEPWTLAKKRDESPEAGAQLATTLHALAETIRIVAELLIPFVPATAGAIATRLGITLVHPWNGALAWSEAMVGKTVNAGDPMFPKLVAPKR
jgi:methionyl-tRNA synthetase